MYLKIIGIVVITVFLEYSSGMAKELNNIDFDLVNNKNASAKSGNLMVDLKDNLISIKADNVPTEDVIRKIVRKSGIRGWILDDGKEKITIEFHNVPLQDGLRKILKNKNYGFVYNQNEEDGGRLRVIKPKKRAFSKPTKVADWSTPGSRVAKNSERKKAIKKTSKSGKKKSPMENIKDLLESMSEALSSSATDEKSSTGAGKSSESLKQVFESLATTTSSEMQGNVVGGEAEQQFVKSILSSINLDELDKLSPNDSSK